MSQTLHFNDKAASQLLAVYVTPDMEAQRREVNRLLQPMAGEKVLDVGSGPGFQAGDIADAVGTAGEVHGIDISIELLALAAERHAHRPQLKFHRAEATRLPFPDCYFDAAVVTQVMEYLPDVQAALRELHRVLRPGGRLLVLDTDWDSLVWHSTHIERMARILAAWDEHLIDPYLPRTLRGKLHAAGFSKQEQHIFPLFNPFFSDDSFSNRMIDMIGPFVTGRQGISAEEVQAWADELRSLGRHDNYFFSLNRYLFLASRP